MPFHVGEKVTLLHALPTEPYILQMQRYGFVIEQRPSGYTIDLPNHVPHGPYGPFAEDRLAHGWLPQQ